MTSEALRARRRELLEMKKTEQELLEQGKGDSFTLYMLKEELLEVDAHLRAVARAGNTPRIGRKRVVQADFGGSRYNIGDRQQYVDWMRADPDEDPDEDRRAMKRLLQAGILSLTDRQREILTIWGEGESLSSIARRLGGNTSTVSRTLSRAKRNAQHVAGQGWTVEQNIDGVHLDAENPAVAKVIVSSLTKCQAVYFYLFYAEQISETDIATLAGVSPSTVSRTIQRAKAKLRKLGANVAVIENVYALDTTVRTIHQVSIDSFLQSAIRTPRRRSTGRQICRLR